MSLADSILYVTNEWRASYYPIYFITRYCEMECSQITL